jgi:hypothetical protein
VQIYLRNESLRLRIFELERTLRSLHPEFCRLDPSRTILEQRIKTLEGSLATLKQETS